MLIANYNDIHNYEPSDFKPTEHSSDEETAKSVYQTRKVAADGNSSAKLKFLESVKPGTQLLYDKQTVTLVPSGIFMFRELS